MAQIIFLGLLALEWEDLIGLQMLLNIASESRSLLKTVLHSRFHNEWAEVGGTEMVKYLSNSGT